MFTAVGPNPVCLASSKACSCQLWAGRSRREVVQQQQRLRTGGQGRLEAAGQQQQQQQREEGRMTSSCNLSLGELPWQWL
jgi:hypothetical protein